MQNSKKLEELLRKNLDEHNYIITLKSIESAFPELSEANLNQLLFRAQKSGLTERICKGVYAYSRVNYDPSLVLFQTAKTLRFPEFMYVSLETVLSSLSVISQQMLSCITVITSGRSSIVDCSRFGKIEFVHTQACRAEMHGIRYDEATGMFWADEKRALQDMKNHRRRLMSLLEE